jgi:hypothetical protein
MFLVFILLDIQAKRIIERDGKRRLIDREIAQKLLPINRELESKLEKKMAEAGMKQSAHDFLIRAILHATIIGILVFAITIFFLPGYVSILSTIVFIAVSIYLPISQINSRIKSLQLERSLALPRYIKRICTLLITKTPYEAISESLKYAQPCIKPYATQLLIEINQYPNSSIPYDNFAKAINVKQARQSMNLLYQSFDVSQKNSIEFLAKLKNTSDVLEEEAAKKMSLKEIKAMEQYNRILFFCLLSIPLSLAGVVFWDAMSSM